MKTYTLKDAPNGVGIRGQRPSIISTNVDQSVVSRLINQNPKLLNEPAVMIFNADMSTLWPEEIPEGAYLDYRTDGIVFVAGDGEEFPSEVTVAFVLHDIETSVQIGYSVFDEEQGEDIFTSLIEVTTEATGLTATEHNFSGTSHNIGNLITGRNYSSGDEISIRGKRYWNNDGTFKFAAFAPGMALTAIDRTANTDTISFELALATGVDSITVKRRQGSSSGNPYQISVKKTGQSRTEDSNMNGLSNKNLVDFMLVATPVSQDVQALGTPDAFHATVYNGVTLNLGFSAPLPCNDQYDNSTADTYDTPNMIVNLNDNLFGSSYLSNVSALLPNLYYDSLETYYRFAKGTSYNVAVQTLAAGNNSVSSHESTHNTDNEVFAMYTNNTGSDVEVTITPTALTAGKIKYKVGTLIPDSNTEDLTPVIPGFTYQAFIDSEGTAEARTVKVPTGMTLIVDPIATGDSATTATVTVGN
jgi:hypothetical protein